MLVHSISIATNLGEEKEKEVLYEGKEEQVKGRGGDVCA